MNVIHGLQFPEEMGKATEKRREYLISKQMRPFHLQFRETKGDLHKEDGFKNNTIEPKLIYVHEGLRKEARRANVLPDPSAYFSRVTEGEGGRLWNEVYVHFGYLRY